MNRLARLVTCATTIGFLGLTVLSPSWSQAGDKTEKELITLQNDWATARVKRDVGFLERLYAKEFRITAMNGTIVGRETDIAKFASGELRPESITDEDLRVAVYGEVAVVTGRETMKGPYKGESIELAVLFTNVFVRREGRWQLVTHHSTATSPL